MSNQIQPINIGYKSAIVTGNVLPVGSYTGQIIKVLDTNSFVQNPTTGETKAELPEWVDPTPQIAIVFKADDNQGVITERFQCLGYLKADDEKFTALSAKQKALFYVGNRNYVIKVADNTRTKSSENTQSCKDILDQFFTRMKMPEGSDLTDIVGKRVAFTVVENDKGKNGRLDRDSVRPIGNNSTNESASIKVEAEEVSLPDF